VRGCETGAGKAQKFAPNMDSERVRVIVSAKMSTSMDSVESTLFYFLSF
jgi:hypothetical protein